MRTITASILVLLICRGTGLAQDSTGTALAAPAEAAPATPAPPAAPAPQAPAEATSAVPAEEAPPAAEAAPATPPAAPVPRAPAEAAPAPAVQEAAEPAAPVPSVRSAPLVKDTGARNWKYWLRKPAASMTASLLIPGSGELANNKLVGLVFLGAEAALWTAYLVIMNEGDKYTDAYEKIADKYWKEADYLSLEDTSMAFYQREVLPEGKDQAYYDAITHNQFSVGWTDFDDITHSTPPTDLTYQTESQQEVEERIDKANKYYRTAGYAKGAIILNHVVSAISAYRCAKMNQATQKVSLQYGVKPRNAEPQPYVTLTAIF